ncbi:MAG TPA: hypothetical protein VKA55_03600 [Gammaproteobacteria bacterium]|nr:hypothetical protein [Gammaproteobacteria bacterium]
MYKVRINDGDPTDVATLRLGWRAIDEAFAEVAMDQVLTWSIQAFDGSLQRERQTGRQWSDRFGGPLAFSKFLEGREWVDRG